MIFVDVLGPVVVLVIVGAVAGPRLGLSTDTLAPLAYWMLGPAFVFDLLAGADVGSGLVVRLVVAGLAGMVAAGGVAVVAGRAAGLGRSLRSATTLTAVYGNVGNAGLAITAFALGDHALPAATVLMITINITGIMLGIGLASARSSSVTRAVFAAVRAPMTLAAAAAVAVNVVDADIPLVVDRSVGLLAGALIPVMLVTLGLQLATSRRVRPGASLAISSTAKLIAAPVAAALVGSAVGLDGDDLGAVLIQSAMPPAVFCVLIALQHDLEPEEVTSTVVTTTLLALITLPVVLAVAT